MRSEREELKVCPTLEQVRSEQNGLYSLESRKETLHYFLVGIPRDLAVVHHADICTRAN